VLRRALLVLVCLALLPAVAQSAAEGRFTMRGAVTHVVDGDTLDVRLDGGRRERVRLIGLDTPEVGTCGASAATSAARRLAGRARVVLRGDATQATRDRYGRLLAYVWLPGGRDLGFRLLAEGHGRVYVYDRPFERLGAYKRAEQVGRLRRPTCAPPPAPPPRTGVCDPSYPGVCIPPPPPDLDCADVEYRAFRVLQPDPHRFDGDADGVGCES
jgi:micrococcal nuclease